MGWEDTNAPRSANAEVGRKGNRSETKPRGAGGKEEQSFLPLLPQTRYLQ